MACVGTGVLALDGSQVPRYSKSSGSIKWVQSGWRGSDLSCFYDLSSTLVDLAWDISAYTDQAVV